VSAARGRSTDDVVPTSTQAYSADKPRAAVRPLNSVLDLSKITAAGFRPRDWRAALSEYVSSIE
jgi:dTDP-4-dehydrorhamnose reductase